MERKEKRLRLSTRFLNHYGKVAMAVISDSLIASAVIICTACLPVAGAVSSSGLWYID